MDIDRLKKLSGLNEASELQFEEAMDQLVHVLQRDIKSGMLDLGPEGIAEIEHLLRSVASEVAGPAYPHQIDIQGADDDVSFTGRDSMSYMNDR